MKISQLIGMEVYTDNARYLGKVYDIILDLQKGEVARLTLEPIKVSSKEEAKRVFHEKTIMYKSVKAVDRIILTSSNPIQESFEEETLTQPTKPIPYSYKYKRA